MSNVVNIYANSFAFLNSNAQGANVHTGQSISMGKADYLFFKFGAPPSSINYKRIVSANAFVYLLGVVGYDGRYVTAHTRRLKKEFDPETITYASGPVDYMDESNYVYTEFVYLTDMPAFAGLNVSSGNSYAATYQEYGFALYELAGSYWEADERLNVQTTGANRPYLQIEVDDTTTVGLKLDSATPAAGSIVKTEANTFTWSASPEFRCLPQLKQSSAVFRWRAGTSGTVHTISVSDSAQSVTIPANTFAGTTSIQWQIAVTANSGVVTTSDWMTLSTADATPTSAPLSPVDTVIDGSKDMLFQWQHTISTGTAQSKAELQKSEDGSTWTALATVTGSARQWTCPAGTLTSSIKYWRVRTYNADGVAGDWSEAAQIVVIAAPSAPSIQIKSTGPRPSISWQTSEQEAYQVELDGTLSGGTHYGAEKSWTSPAYLADGSHAVRVRVQNQYGMWSDWGTAALPVTNTPGAAITLAVEASSVAELSWQTTGSYDYYLVYRDGKPIAKLAQTQYTDELSSGSVRYQVRGCYDDSSNYGLSAEVNVQVLADVHMVSDLDTGETLRLPYSDSQHRQTTRTLSRQVELLQLSGAYYPVAVEVDSGTDALSITAALTDDEQVRKLMSLVGKLICAKTPQGDMVIGYITSLPKQHDGFLNVFSFTIERIAYDDEVTL